MVKPNNKKPPNKPNTRSNSKPDDNIDDTQNNNVAKFYRKIEPIERKRHNMSNQDEQPNPKKIKLQDKFNPNLPPKINIINLILDKIHNEGVESLKSPVNNVSDDSSDDELWTQDTESTDEDTSSEVEEDEKYITLLGSAKLKGDIKYSIPEVKWLNNQTEEYRDKIYDIENTIIDINTNEMPLRFRILHSNSINIKTKAIILDQLSKSTTCSNTSEEDNKLIKWVNLLDKIPFDKTIQPIVTNQSCILDILKYLTDAKTTLDNEVYGHDIAKHQIIAILAREVSNPNSMGNVFAIQGPMGNGKTTLVKHGICKAMNRPFGFIPLGGMQDSSYLTGHEYTYVGSKPGRIVEILMETGCMNPVFYFDELDKISDTSKGEEIINVLCHLTDTTQNHAFHDKYFSGIDFNLSQATFIFSYNDESKINPILLDRMNKIKTDGFDTKSKSIIASKYLLPKILKEFSFSSLDITIEDDALNNIISNYTENENGVRNLKRCLEEIISNCNISRYDIKGELLKKNKVYEFPIKINSSNLRDFLNPKKDNLAEHLAYSMYL